MDTDEEESSIAELMDAVLNFHSRESEVLGLVFKYLPVNTLKLCRTLCKDLHVSATKCLVERTRVRLDNVSLLRRYIQETSTQQTVWENYKIVVSNKLSAELLVQFGRQCGNQVKVLDLEIRYRDNYLAYLGDLIAEHLPNLEEFSLRGKFPSAGMFISPQRMVGKLEKLQVFNLYARGWHRLPPLPNGEVTFKSPVIGQIIASMPNLTKIKYFPDVISTRDAHRHHSSFLSNLTENEDVVLNKLTEIQHFSLSFIDIPCMEKFASKRFPLKELRILVEEEVQPEQLCLFLETFHALTHLVIQSATENPLKWPRLLRLEDLALIGVNVHGTDFLACFPSLRNLHVSQDRVTTVDFALDRSLQVPHTLTCLKLVEDVAVNAAYRISDNGLSVIFRNLPYLLELAIMQNYDSTQSTFSDEGITGAKMSICYAGLSVRPRDLRSINGNLMRFNHCIGDLKELQKLTLRASNISDIALLCGVVNCQHLVKLDISSPQISERACIELMDYLNVSSLRIQDFGGFTSSGKSEILVRMKFQEVFYA